MHNDGENITLNSLSNEFPSTKIQSANDCFRLGKTIDQFPCLFLPSTQSLSLVEVSEPAYSFIKSLNTNEYDHAFKELHDDEDDATADDNEDNLICEITTHADHHTLCEAKAAHVAVLRKIYASLAKNSYY